MPGAHAQGLPGVTLTHTRCQVHKISIVEKNMSAILAGHVGGMVSLGLAMRSAGAVRELQEALFAYKETWW